MLRILHLITCYAGASPQGEAFLKILHCTLFETSVTLASLAREVAFSQENDGRSLNFKRLPLTQRYLNRLCTLTPSVAYRDSFLSEEAYQVSANFKVKLSFLFVANVTSASFVQREVARDSVTEGLFFQILTFFPLCHRGKKSFYRKCYFRPLTSDVARLAVTDNFFFQIPIFRKNDG